MSNPFKIGDRVDVIGSEINKNLEIVGFNGDYVDVKWPDGSHGFWHYDVLKLNIFKPMKFKVGDRVDFISKAAIGNVQHTNLEVLNSIVKIKWPDGAVGWWSEERFKPHVPGSKVRVFHTNVMYYVMPDGTVFYQPPLLKSDFTLESLLNLDGIKEITT